MLDAMTVGDVKKKNVEGNACKALYFYPRRIQ